MNNENTISATTSHDPIYSMVMHNLLGNEPIFSREIKSIWLDFKKYKIWDICDSSVNTIIACDNANHCSLIPKVQSESLKR